jgi:ABC-2 type transport system ATP-binding protein
VAFLKQITLVMGQKQQLLWDLPPADTFELNRAVYDIPTAQYREMLGELTELLELSQIVRTPTRQLSLGERMKCELLAALLHRPRVLFLDEPTIGLDVSMQVVLRQFIRTYNERYAATVLLTSHYMEDVVALCPRVLVIAEGQLRYDGDLKTLVHRLRPEKQVTVRLSAPVVVAELARLGTVVSSGPTQAVLQIAQSELRAAVAHLLEQFPVTDLTVEDPPLQEVLRDLFAQPPAAPTPGSGGP